MRKKA